MKYDIAIIVLNKLFVIKLFLNSDYILKFNNCIYIMLLNK